MRNQRGLLFLALAALLGLGAVMTAQSLLEGRNPAVPVMSSVETVPVVVARTDVPVGSALESAQLTTVDWPEGYVPRGAHSDPRALEGRVSRRALAAGEPILDPSLLPEGAEAGLVSVIGEDRRAVSVKVDPVVGVAGFVTPGSRVDVLATLRRKSSGSDASYSAVILQDIPVLAVDQKMEEARSGEPQLVSVVTLEVDPEQAEKLIYSAHEGRLQLALRNPTDREQVVTGSVSARDLLPGARTAAPARRSGPRVEVIRGSSVTYSTF